MSHAGNQPSRSRGVLGESLLTLTPNQSTKKLIGLEVCSVYDMSFLVLPDQLLAMWSENPTLSHPENHPQMFIDIVMLSPNYSPEPCLKTWGWGATETEDDVEAVHSSFCPAIPAILAFSLSL